MFTLRLLTPPPLDLIEGSTLPLSFEYSGTGSFSWSYSISTAGQTGSLTDVSNISGSGSVSVVSSSAYTDRIDLTMTGRTDTLVEGDETIGLRLVLTGAAQFEGGGQDRTFTVRIADVLTGTPGPDTLPGTPGDDIIRALGDDDWITPGTGSDSIDGGTGIDMLSLVDLTRPAVVDMGAGTAISGTDTDRFTAIEHVTGTVFADLITGDAGANRLRGLGDFDWFVGSGGGDSFDGGTGLDMVSYVAATAGVTVNLNIGRGTAGQALGDSYVSIERATGSSFNDTLYGGAGEENLRGLGGDDLMFATTGGRDRFDGGAGRDTVSYVNSFGVVTGSGVAGIDASLLLGRGSGSFAARDLYTSIENLIGSSYDDRLTGDHLGNTLEGGAGDDFLFGNGGNDRLVGGFDDDSLDGGGGQDTAVFLHARSSYAIATAGGITTVTLIVGSTAGEVDRLVNIELLTFADQTLTL